MLHLLPSTLKWRKDSQDYALKLLQAQVVFASLFSESRTASSQVRKKFIWVDVLAICTRHPLVSRPASGLLLSHKNSGNERKKNSPQHQIIRLEVQGTLGWVLKPLPRNEGQPAAAFHYALAGGGWPNLLCPSSWDATWDLSYIYQCPASSYLKQPLEKT